MLVSCGLAILWATSVLAQVEPKWDTVYCEDGGAKAMALTVSNHGNLGHQGIGKANLDYWIGERECAVWDDSADENPWLGDSRIYLYDASPIFLWLDTEWVYYAYSMHDTSPGDGSFMPGEDPSVESPAWFAPQGLPDEANLHYSVFFAKDSSLRVERVLVAPNSSDPQFMIQATRFTNLARYPMYEVALGEVIDWNIPTDSGNWNGSGFDSTRNLIYQYGMEFDQDSLECLDNDLRYGGLAVLGIYENHANLSDDQHGLYTMDNVTQVEPLGRFHRDSIWNHMGNPGYGLSDSSGHSDLHMVATYRYNHTLLIGGNLTVFTLLVTEYDGGLPGLLEKVDEGIAWYNLIDPHVSCCRYVGDFNHSGIDGDPSTGAPDIADLICLVTYMFASGLQCNACSDGPNPYWGPFPEADFNCSGHDWPDIGDLIYMVTFMFQGGPPSPCWIVGDPEDMNTWIPACNR